MTSNHHAPYEQGYTRATMAVTECEANPREGANHKGRPSSDCSLQPDYTKLESLVIANQNVAVNTFPGLVHTARHTMESEMPEASDPTFGGAVEVEPVTGVKS